jgi:beta-glucanase (GH16 family)
MGRGTWPAFWMLPENVVYGSNYWPDNGEIDIMEYVGYQPSIIYGSVHTNKNYGGNSVTSKITYYGVENEFHTYAIEWTYDAINYYVDSYLYGSYKRMGRDWHYWPFDQNFFILLNFAVGGNWGGAQGVDNTIFPQTYEIDYVRVYDIGYSVNIPSNPNKVSVAIYPNPTSSFIDIKLDENSSGKFQTSIYDLQGKTVIPQTDYEGTSCTINLSKLNAGIYFLKVTTGNKSSTYKVFKN